jgi:hypothetical protein
MDVTGLRELRRQNEFARSNRHNLTVVRATDAIERVLKLTGVQEMLVLVVDPDDLVPPPVTHSPASGQRRLASRCCIDITSGVSLLLRARQLPGEKPRSGQGRIARSLIAAFGAEASCRRAGVVIRFGRSVVAFLALA